MLYCNTLGAIYRYGKIRYRPSSTIHVSGSTMFLPSILYPISLATRTSLSASSLSFNYLARDLLTDLTAHCLGFRPTAMGWKIETSSAVGEQTSQQLVPDGSDSELPRAFSNTLLRQFSLLTQNSTSASSLHVRISQLLVKMWPLDSCPHLQARPISYNRSCMIAQLWWLQLLNWIIENNEHTWYNWAIVSGKP